MSIGAGIAIAGIWIGVGMVGLRDGGAGAMAAMCAMFATLFVAIAIGGPV